MAGGLMQLITYGTQDLTLTGNPQITFFNIIYRRYTNFGKKIIEISFNNSPNFNLTSYINIPKNNGVSDECEDECEEKSTGNKRPRLEESDTNALKENKIFTESIY